MGIRYVRGLQEVYGVIWGVGMALPHGMLTNKRFVPLLRLVGLEGVQIPCRSGLEGGGEYWLLLEVNCWSVLQYVIPYVWQLIFTQVPV